MNERYIAADAPILDPELAGIGSLRQSVRLTMRRFADNFDRTRIAGRNVRWMAGAAPCALLRNSFGGTRQKRASDGQNIPALDNHRNLLFAEAPRIRICVTAQGLNGRLSYPARASKARLLA
jgi:hypothetical protein